MIKAFGGRLRDQVDLTTLTGELLGVVDQTMQPSQASLWLRPSVGRPPAAGSAGRCPDFRVGDPGCDAEAASGEPA